MSETSFELIRAAESRTVHLTEFTNHVNSCLKIGGDEIHRVGKGNH